MDYKFGLVTDRDTDETAKSVRHAGNLRDSTYEFCPSVRASCSAARFALHKPLERIGWGDPADCRVRRPACLTLPGVCVRADLSYRA